MNLRTQIYNIGVQRIGAAFVTHTHFPIVVKELAVMAFTEQWPETYETRAIRRALKLLEHGGVSDSDSEPAEPMASIGSEVKR